MEDNVKSTILILIKRAIEELEDRKYITTYNTLNELFRFVSMYH